MILLFFLVSECALCGESAREGARYCASCGTPIRDAEEAERDAGAAIERDPRNAEAWAKRARARAARGDLAAARLDADRALELDGFRASFWLDRGRIHLLAAQEEVDLRAAIEDFAQALRLDPKSTRARASRADALIRLADLRGENGVPQRNAALLFLQEALDLDPADVGLWLRLADLRILRGEFAEATEAARRALAIRKTAPAHLVRARARAAQRRFAEALEDANEAVRLAPESAEARLARGRLLISLGRFSDAVAEYSEVLHRRRDHADALVGRGRARLAGAEPLLAIDDLSRALELRPNDGDALEARGAAYFALRRYDPAIADWTRAIELRPPLRARLAPLRDEARRKRGEP